MRDTIATTKASGESTAMTTRLSVSLPSEMVRMVKAKVASGQYASESEVVHDGLVRIAAHDADVEGWLQRDVLPLLESIDADPFQLLSADEAWARLGRTARP